MGLDFPDESLIEKMSQLLAYRSIWRKHVLNCNSFPHISITCVKSTKTKKHFAHCIILILFFYFKTKQIIKNMSYEQIHPSCNFHTDHHSIFQDTGIYNYDSFFLAFLWVLWFKLWITLPEFFYEKFHSFLWVSVRTV